MLTDLIGSGKVSNLSLEVERELTRSDIETLWSPVGEDGQPRVVIGPPQIQSVSARHRRQAMLLAQGMSVHDVAHAVGTTPERISTLKSDPTFSGLVDMYREMITEKWKEDQERITGKLIVVTEMALDEMADRLEGEKPKNQVSYGELRKTVELGADRTVAPPKNLGTAQSNTPQTITLNFGTDLRPQPVSTPPPERNLKVIEHENAETDDENDEPHD